MTQREALNDDQKKLNWLLGLEKETLAHMAHQQSKIIEKLQKAAKAQPQWISVSERLPEYGTNVLIVVDGETEAENQVFEFKSGKWSSSDFFESNKDDGRYYYVREVEYWAPLPAAPE